MRYKKYREKENKIKAIGLKMLYSVEVKVRRSKRVRVIKVERVELECM